MPYDDVRFPDAPELQDHSSTTSEALPSVPVERRPDGPQIEETDTIDPAWIVTVRLTDLTNGDSQEYGLIRRG